VQEQYEAALDREGSLTRDEKLKSKFDTLMGDGKKTIYRLLPKLPIFSIKSKEEVS